MKDLMEEKILLYASDRFFGKDPRITMESVAKDLSISKKTLYKYFKNRDDLLNGVFSLLKKEITDIFESTFKRNKCSFIAMFETIALLTPKLGIKMDYFSLEHIKRVSPKLWKDIKEFRSNQINKYIPLAIKSGIKNGYIRKDINAHVSSLIFFSLVDNIINPDFLMDASISGKDAVKEVLGIFFYGITTQKGKKKFNKHFKNIFEVKNEK
jgi:AcrR family transcriptional regulator